MLFYTNSYQENKSSIEPEKNKFAGLKSPKPISLRSKV